MFAGGFSNTHVTANSSPRVSANGKTLESLPMIKQVPDDLTSRAFVPGRSRLASANSASCLASIKPSFSFFAVHPARSLKSIRSSAALRAFSAESSSVNCSKIWACCSQAKTTCSLCVSAATAISKSSPQSWSVTITSSKPWPSKASGLYLRLPSQRHKIRVVLVFIVVGFLFVSLSP